MGRIRTWARTALQAVAHRVAQDPLFERPGEAGPAPAPLPRRATPSAAVLPAQAAPKPAAPTATAASPAPATASHPAHALELPWARAAGARLVDIDGAKRLVAAGGGLRLVNHWATWCIPCVEELPVLRALAEDLRPAVATFGIAWDLFDPRGDEEDIVRHVENFGAGHDVSWPSAVLREDTDPAAFFAALDVRFDKVPQTWLVGADGTILHREEGALSAQAAERLRAAAAAHA